MYRSHVLVSGNEESVIKKIVADLNELLVKHRLQNDVKVLVTYSLNDDDKISLIIYPEGTQYYDVEGYDKLEKIVSRHLAEGVIVKELLAKGEEKTDEQKESESEFINRQFRVVLKNSGIIDPESIDEYIAQDGYQALGKALTQMTPEQVVEEIKASGLRGRGGGGFPTGKKWEFACKSDDPIKYICCNADEGDPGAFMDRSVLEGDPHAVIEAMAIAGYAIGAHKGYIYVRAEYPRAVSRLEIAIAQAKEYGLLGKNIFDSGFDFDLEIRLGAGAFVCGEETALLTSIEGNRGEPHPKPPFPAVKGLFGHPTVLNNVETFANIPQIILKGADWFNSIGTEKSKGTKVFALGGKIEHVGLVEVPMGTTLRKVIYKIGGGIPNGKRFKAAQTGGPSGGCIPAEYLDIPMDYDNLIGIGSMMGSGGLIIMDEDNCMVDMAKFFLEFTVDESCGMCTACRVGNKRLYELLTKITDGEATMEDLDKLEELCYYIKDNSLCGLGQSAPNPVLSTLKYFRDEYIAHIKDKNIVNKYPNIIIAFKFENHILAIQSSVFRHNKVETDFHSEVIIRSGFFSIAFTQQIILIILSIARIIFYITIGIFGCSYFVT